MAANKRFKTGELGDLKLALGKAWQSCASRLGGSVRPCSVPLTAQRSRETLPMVYTLPALSNA